MRIIKSSNRQECSNESFAGVLLLFNYKHTVRQMYGKFFQMTPRYLSHLHIYFRNDYRRQFIYQREKIYEKRAANLM